MMNSVNTTMFGTPMTNYNTMNYNPYNNQSAYSPYYYGNQHSPSVDHQSSVEHPSSVDHPPSVDDQYHHYNEPIVDHRDHHIHEPSVDDQTSSLLSDPTYPSICIPRTHHSVSWKIVKDAFEELFGGGCIEKVDVVKRTHQGGQKSVKVFVHFNAWPNTEYAQNIRQKIVNGKTIKVVYNFPWYWKCVMSHSPKRRWLRSAPYIMNDDDSAESHNKDSIDDGDYKKQDLESGADVSSDILACMDNGIQLPDGRIVDSMTHDIANSHDM